jgi:hypothetical protein
MLAPGHCSPSRSVVSKIIIFSIFLTIANILRVTLGPVREAHKAEAGWGLEICEANF